MADVLFGESFTVEDVAQVCPTVGTKDLGSNSISVELLFDRARYLIVEGGPATTRMEFVRRVVQRYSAISAHVDALFEMICVFARERRFCPLLEQDEPFKLVQIGIDDLSHVHHTFLSILCTPHLAESKGKYRFTSKKFRSIIIVSGGFRFGRYG